MLNEAKYHICLKGLVNKELDLLNITDEAKRTKLQNDVAEFMKLRLKNVLSEAGIRYDVVDAVFVDINDMYAVGLRAEAVNEAVKAEEAAQTIQAFNRAGNIARKADGIEAAVNPDIFVNEVEGVLNDALKLAKAKVENAVAEQNYAVAIDELTKLAAPIDNFFDAVMVMDKDEAVKNNRLGLLKSVDNLICQVADFSKIVLA